eukprot:526926_1
MDFNHENDEIVWQIDGQLLDRMKHAKYKTRFGSPYFCAINVECHFIMYPNGRNQRGIAEWEIYCLLSERSDDDVYHQFCYYVEIAETNFCQKCMNGYAIKQEERLHVPLKSPYLFDELQTLSKLTVYIKIWKPNPVLSITNNITQIEQYILNKEQIIKSKREMEQMEIKENSIKWVVKDELLQRIKSATNMQKFYSPFFRSNDGSVWRIKFYPNGWREYV